MSNASLSIKENMGVALIQESVVVEKIALIRGQNVIADADVAELYGVETRIVNQAVKNNPDKFPLDYMFELTKGEVQELKSKILISKVSDNNRRGTKVFTEKGLYMLATILKSERATAVTFAIIETFAKVRGLKRELVELHKEKDKHLQSEKINHFVKENRQLAENIASMEQKVSFCYFLIFVIFFFHDFTFNFFHL